MQIENEAKGVVKHPILGEVEEQEILPPCERLARYTVLVWVGGDNARDAAVMLDCQETYWVRKDYQKRGRGFGPWEIWDGRALEENGFPEYSIPKEPGLYLMDVTFWTTGGEDADFNHQVNKAVKIDLRPQGIEKCPRCGKEKDTVCYGESDGEKTIETGYACAMCHAKRSAKAEQVLTVLRDAAVRLLTDPGAFGACGSGPRNTKSRENLQYALNVAADFLSEEHALENKRGDSDAS